MREVANYSRGMRVLDLEFIHDKSYLREANQLYATASAPRIPAKNSFPMIKQDTFLQPAPEQNTVFFAPKHSSFEHLGLDHSKSIASTEEKDSAVNGIVKRKKSVDFTLPVSDFEKIERNGIAKPKFIEGKTTIKKVDRSVGESGSDDTCSNASEETVSPAVPLAH